MVYYEILMSVRGIRTTGLSRIKTTLSGKLYTYQLSERPKIGARERSPRNDPEKFLRNVGYYENHL